jgi:hypothetical protein
MVLFRGLIYQYLLIVPHLLLVAVLVALFRHRLYRHFPIFFAYVVQELVQAVFMIPLIESPSLTFRRYAIPYTISLAISTALRFGIIYEIFAHIFRNYPALARFGKPVFRWATVGLILLALGSSFVAWGSNGDYFPLVLSVFDRTVSFLQCGLLVSLFLFSAQLALSWKSQVFGIALGVGVNASADLAAAAIRFQTGVKYTLALDYFVMAVYHFCVLIWIFYLFAPERSYAPKALPQHDLETWNLELERLLKQ